MYNILMSLYAFGVWVASHFSEKIKKMWNLNIFGSTLLHWASLNRVFR